MSQSNTHHVGIDVSKHKLDVALFPQPEVFTFPYTPQGLAQLLALLKSSPVTLVCLEATGGLERELLELLQQHHFAVSVVNPRQIRDFARATNQLAKTDVIDARVISRFAALLESRRTLPLTAAQRKLRDLTARKRQVVKLLIQEKNRLAATRDSGIRQMIQQALDLYQQQLETIVLQQQQLIAQDQAAQEKARLITTVPGLGAATAATLISDLPELGSLNRQQIARLIGVAPTNRDSGTLRGKRTTGGGRVEVRNALYMPLVVAIRHNPAIKTFYQRLLAHGKPKLVALIASMRKLITILNVMIRNNEPWRKSPQTT